MMGLSVVRSFCYLIRQTGRKQCNKALQVANFKLVCDFGSFEYPAINGSFKRVLSTPLIQYFSAEWNVIKHFSIIIADDK